MEYKIIKTDRRTVSLSVGDDLVPVVRAPLGACDSQLDEFVNKNLDWIEKAVKRKALQLEKYNLSEDEIKNLIDKARVVIPARVAFFSELMDVCPTGVKITTAKKRFGSCSGKNSLCFSCFLMLYPNEAIDYVVVHELAHIKHHNHSKQFYALVEKYLPDYKKREQLLRRP